MKKIITGIIVLAMIFSLINFNQVSASSDKQNNNVETGDTQLESVTISNDSLTIEEVPDYNANVMERNCIEQYSLSDEIQMFSTAEDVSENTEPNSAYVVSNGMVVQGNIASAGEMRWYAFVLTEKSKISILTQMVSEVDADLYMFSLNTNTMQLGLIGGSANEGKGISEYYNEVLDAGTYFFAIGGYEGTGAFAFAFYQSTGDVENEVNDSKDAATNITLNQTMNGIIDNPYDIDYYKVSINNSMIVQYSISSSDGYSLLYASGTGSIYPIESSKNENKNIYKFTSGTYYFAVVSQDGNCSQTSTYSLNFKKVGELSGSSSVKRLGISAGAGIVYETNNLGTVNYVNGNPIDISYSYYRSFSNSAGSQLYDITIDGNAGARALQSDVFEPAAVYYLSSTRPAMNVNHQSALLLTFYSENDFYKINCRCTGAYSKNTLVEDLNNVTVLIDPASGNLIDIAEFNYFYDYAPEGSNSITWTRSYSMEFYSE